MKTYNILRKIHFYSAAITAVFLILYFVTGYLLGKYAWFDDESKPSEVRELSIGVPSDLTGWNLARWVKAHADLTGKIDWVNERPSGEWVIEIVTPQTNHMVTVPATKDRLVIESRETNGYQRVTALHRMHRYGGGLLYDLYLFGMDLACISLLLFAITGTYLWIQLIRHKWLGWVMLALGFGYTGIVIVTWLSA